MNKITQVEEAHPSPEGSDPNYGQYPFRWFLILSRYFVVRVSVWVRQIPVWGASRLRRLSSADRRGSGEQRLGQTERECEP